MSNDKRNYQPTAATLLRISVPLVRALLQVHLEVLEF